MKRNILWIVGIIVIVWGVTKIADFGKDVEVGGTYRGDGQIVTVEYVGRGDSVLVHYPGMMYLSENALSMKYVVYATATGKAYMADIMFKQKFDRVYSTPPDTPPPSRRALSR